MIEAIARFFVTGFQVKRPTRTPDNKGSWTETTSTVVTTEGRLRQLTSNEILANEKIGIVSTHRFYCPVIDVRALDYIYDSNTLKTYKVTGTPNNVMNMDRFLQVDCQIKE
jgi:hypothetical protein